MKAPWFTSIKHINWNRVAIIVGGTAIVWSGLAAIIPPRYHTIVMVVLSSIQSGFTFVLRANKYVAERGIIPAAGEQP